MDNKSIDTSGSGDLTIARKGPGRPRKYATDEERETALKKQKQENSRNYYHANKEKILAQMATKYAVKKGNIHHKIQSAINLLLSQGYTITKDDKSVSEESIEKCRDSQNYESENDSSVFVQA